MTVYYDQWTLEYKDNDHIKMQLRTKQDAGEWTENVTVLDVEENTVIILNWNHLDAHIKDAFAQRMKIAKDRMGA